ncbi:cupin domain-containing protein [Azospirillum halopraeferens]|uniref:cupin domain-containing protein n=1 Tax=Azospirillum halopraeferens TaxID=34010 RepID=UPI00040CBBE1|nr:cupin domain-containing protein [Azospirillum halopraeferens]
MTDAPVPFTLLDPAVAAVETGGPDPGRIIAGTPVFTTRNAYESADGKRFAGVWSCTPGVWRIRYDEWEHCRITEGTSVITHTDGRSWTVRAGDSFVLEPGFEGTWEVVETTTKQYVVILP